MAGTDCSSARRVERGYGIAQRLIAGSGSGSRLAFHPVDGPAPWREATVVPAPLPLTGTFAPVVEKGSGSFCVPRLLPPRHVLLQENERETICPLSAACSGCDL